MGAPFSPTLVCLTKSANCLLFVATPESVWAKLSAVLSPLRMGLARPRTSKSNCETKDGGHATCGISARCDVSATTCPALISSPSCTLHAISMALSRRRNVSHTQKRPQKTPSSLETCSIQFSDRIMAHRHCKNYVNCELPTTSSVLVSLVPVEIHVLPY